MRILPFLLLLLAAPAIATTVNTTPKSNGALLYRTQLLGHMPALRGFS